MHKCEASNGARAATSWHRHIRADGKARVNKNIRRSVRGLLRGDSYAIGTEQVNRTDVRTI